MNCGVCKGKIDKGDRFCRHCGGRFSNVPQRELKVKNYKYPFDMEDDMKKMMGQGWRIEGQTGQFSPTFRDFGTKKRVTVTWMRG